jgi:saccharopine dehydrogenase-like NADP-dependent oxidoreductase
MAKGTVRYWAAAKEAAGVAEEPFEATTLADLVAKITLKYRNPDLERVLGRLPDPADLGDKMRGRTCAGTWVKGLGLDGEPREVYLYHIVDNAWSMKEFGHQAVVWQTAVMPVVAIELMATGVWSAKGVVGPEALPSEPFLELLDEHGMEWEWADYRDRAPIEPVD